VTSIVLRFLDLTMGWPKNSTSSLYDFTAKRSDATVNNLGWAAILLGRP
jgi:hypothetical protein